VRSVNFSFFPRLPGSTVHSQGYLPDFGQRVVDRQIDLTLISQRFVLIGSDRCRFVAGHCALYLGFASSDYTRVEVDLGNRKSGARSSV
jgi:hypothetical protein